MLYIHDMPGETYLVIITCSRLSHYTSLHYSCIVTIYSTVQVRAVNYPDFQDAFLVIRPSVSQEDLGVYVDWNARYGCGVRK